MHWTAGWVSPRAGLAISQNRQIYSPAGIKTKDRPPHSQVTTLFHQSIFDIFTFFHVMISAEAASEMCF
jgi:hypothetical protein